MRFVLASASPRRRELLALLGVPFDVWPVDIDEDAGRSRDPQIVARRLARTKAEAARLTEPDAPIIAADTIVSYESTLLGKPRDAGAARRMLKMLRGQTHDVVTAVALMPPGRRSILGRQPLTRVTMRDYTDAEIEAWIARGGPFDRAGAYAIQDADFQPVERYDGCYCNVVGLPLWPLVEMLRKAELPVEVTAGQLLPQCASCPFARRL
ncbi:MAG: Maf family protein [Chloroflexota bacterium]|nr:Maf family protein [Chloroflexota bacterium]